ncbi:hypothetical protein C427_2075 [Paraglaciecola psychrophila 170]|uniref:Uncharacterized protein n=1 Tax=Paraglaciecola psychrophila 170 TaxID=1129794 RepID=K7AZC7_9ALTE|nr:hypothetical protein C427_2075 [Paraglaciecola psychrophila 170]GAC40420.1 hypothetical protein GPSY_4818 [Paraglaciecola psychrophila 170]
MRYYQQTFADLLNNNLILQRYQIIITQQYVKNRICENVTFYLTLNTANRKFFI